MKNMTKVLFLMFWALFLVTGHAMAVPSNLHEILTEDKFDGTEVYRDIGAEEFTLTDANGNNDDATAFLMLEFAGFANENTFGIYSFDDIDGEITVKESLEIFTGSDSPLTSTTLAFDIANNTVTNQTTKETINLDPLRFGFYIIAPQTSGKTYYTHASLNEDGFDHAMVFDTSDNSIGSLLGSDIIIAFEDLWEGGDQDFTDMVVGISDIQPIPEPATLLLMGLGLFGLACIGRKKYKKIG